MPRELRPIGTIHDGTSTTGIGKTFDVSEYRHVYFLLSAAANSTFTINFQGSLLEEAPDFGSGQTGTNHWDYINVIDVEDAAAIDGDTGVTIDNTTEAVNTRMFKMDTDFMHFVNANISAYTDGDATLKVVGVNDTN